MAKRLFVRTLAAPLAAAVLALALTGCPSANGTDGGSAGGGSQETGTQSAFFNGTFIVGDSSYNSLLLAADQTYVLSAGDAVDTGTYKVSSARSLDAGDYVLTSSTKVVFGVTITGATVELKGEGDDEAFTVKAEGNGKTIAIDEAKASIAQVTLTAGDVYECSGAYQYVESTTKVHAAFPANGGYEWFGLWEPQSGNPLLWSQTKGEKSGNSDLALLEFDDKLWVVHPDAVATKTSGSGIFGTWKSGNQTVILEENGTYKQGDSYGYFAALEGKPGVYTIVDYHKDGEGNLHRDETMFIYTDDLGKTGGLYRIEDEWKKQTDTTLTAAVKKACEGK